MVSLSGAEIVILIVALAAYSLLFLLVAQALRKGVRVVKQGEVMVLERFGKYKATLKPGLHYIFPFVEEPRSMDWREQSAAAAPSSNQDGSGLNDKTEAESESSKELTSSGTEIRRVRKDTVDIREHVLDFGKQHVVTKDTVPVQVDALMYFRVMDPRTAVYSVRSLPDALEVLTHSNLRHIIAHLTLDDAFASRALINSILLESVRPEAERWGVQVNAVKILNISVPQDIKSAMELQIKEERERRAAILVADGEREAAIVKSRGDAARTVLSSEGKKAALISRSRGEAEARMLTSEAEAECVRAMKDSVSDVGVRATDYLSALQYLQSLEGLSTRGDKCDVVMLPADSLPSQSE